MAKRLLDIVGAVVLLALALPLLLVVAILIRLVDGPPVLFRQTRVGQCGRRFEIFKLRSMRAAPGREVTARDDSRITTRGRALRRAKLDELPQLWNVLRGEMSLVGPRPEVPTYADRLSESFRRLGTLKPGLTDFASIAFRDEEDVLAARTVDAQFYARELLPRKLALARLYRRHRSLALDARLIVATALLVIGAESAAQALVGRRIIGRARAGMVEPGSQQPIRSVHGR